MKKFALGLLEATFVLAFAGPATAAGKSAPGVAAEVVNGVVARQTLTLKLNNGTTRTFPVKGNVSLDYAYDGDEVRVTIEKNSVTSVTVVREKK